LKRRQIPLIFCTSKTRSEVKALRREIGNTHPFVVENGGALVIPAGYFPAVAPPAHRAKTYTLMLGRPYDELVRELRAIARQTGIEVRGFHQMTAEEVARSTGLTVQEARMAQRRETGEPFVFQNATPAQIRRFQQLAREGGYSVQKGGRFWHFSGDHDKAVALSALIGFYRLAWKVPIRTIALGDSSNDLLMLQLVDWPILMPKSDGSFASEVLAQMPDIWRAKVPGSSGWSLALLRALRGNGTRSVRAGASSSRTA